MNTLEIREPGLGDGRCPEMDPDSDDYRCTEDAVHPSTGMCDRHHRRIVAALDWMASIP